MSEMIRSRHHGLPRLVCLLATLVPSACTAELEWLPLDVDDSHCRLEERCELARPCDLVRLTGVGGCGEVALPDPDALRCAVNLLQSGDPGRVDVDFTVNLTEGSIESACGELQEVDIQGDGTAVIWRYEAQFLSPPYPVDYGIRYRIKPRAFFEPCLVDDPKFADVAACVTEWFEPDECSPTEPSC